jgi:ABC-type glycerol-3-phosphate transport system permease component
MFLALGICAAVTLAPLAYVFSLSLSLYEESFTILLWPRSFDWLNYIEAWHTAKLEIYLKNSAMVAALALFVNMLAGTLASYVFARFQFHLKEMFFYLFLGSLIVPGVATLVPLFINLKMLGILNSYPALIFPYATQALPLTVIVLRGFFQSLPSALEDAGRVDGASELRVFWSIMLPLAKPGLITVAVLQFVIYWDELVMAITFILDESKKTLPAGLIVLQGEYWTNYPVLAAALMISLIPLLVLYVMLQRYFQKGLIIGSFR